MFLRIIEDIAATGIGVVMGYIVLYFLTRLKKFTVKELGSLFGVILGATVLGFLSKLDNTPAEVFAFYAIGIFIGFVAALVLYWIRYKVPPIMQTFLQKIGLLTKGTP